MMDYLTAIAYERRIAEIEWHGVTYLYEWEEDHE